MVGANLEHSAFVDAALVSCRLDDASPGGAVLEGVQLSAPATFTGVRCDRTTQFESRIIDQYARNDFGPIRCR